MEGPCRRGGVWGALWQPRVQLSLSLCRFTSSRGWGSAVGAPSQQPPSLAPQGTCLTDAWVVQAGALAGSRRFEAAPGLEAGLEGKGAQPSLGPTWHHFIWAEALLSSPLLGCTQLSLREVLGLLEPGGGVPGERHRRRQCVWHRLDAPVERAEHGGARASVVGLRSRLRTPARGSPGCQRRAQVEGLDCPRLSSVTLPPAGSCPARFAPPGGDRGTLTPQSRAGDTRRAPSAAEGLPG